MGRLPDGRWLVISSGGFTRPCQVAGVEAKRQRPAEDAHQLDACLLKAHQLLHEEGLLHAEHTRSFILLVCVPVEHVAPRHVLEKAAL